MTRTLAIAVLTIATFGCSLLPQRNASENPYETAPFYGKYLNTGSALDAQIQQKLTALRATPDSAPLHNELGALLVQKGFPKDAAVELERAVAADRKFYPAWYNLGMLHAAQGNSRDARRALAKTVDLKPGHTQALFQLGLIEEKSGNTDRAVELYAKSFRHNPAMMDVRYNPNVLDSRIIHLAMLKLYPTEQARKSIQFHGAPAGYRTDPATDAAMAAETAKTQAPSTAPAKKQ